MESSDPEILLATAASLQNILQDEKPMKVLTYEDLHQLITERLVFMLMHQMEPLMQLLYRIDVNEQKVKACFAQNDPKQIAPMLAELIIQREMQKQITRKQYR